MINIDYNFARLSRLRLEPPLSTNPTEHSTYERIGMIDTSREQRELEIGIYPARRGEGSVGGGLQIHK
jgi:hypothetical protein